MSALGLILPFWRQLWGIFEALESALGHLSCSTVSSSGRLFFLFCSRQIFKIEVTYIFNCSRFLFQKSINTSSKIVFTADNKQFFQELKEIKEQKTQDETELPIEELKKFDVFFSE